MQRDLVSIWCDAKGAAVVEATILFPIMFMVMAALVLLAMYLPQQAVLQRATQFTATAIGTAYADTWIDYDGVDFSTPIQPVSFYMDGMAIAEKSVRRIENKFTYTMQLSDDKLKVSYDVLDLIIYKEIRVTATRSIPLPVNLSFIGFPSSLDITVSSTAVVQNGDEFIRNMDIAFYFIEWLDGKYHFTNNFEKISESLNIFSELL